jgi:general secretion pathway protein K
MKIKQQAGVALLSALLIMAMATILVTWIYVQEHQFFRQLRLVDSVDRMQASLVAARAFALQAIIDQPSVIKQPNKDIVPAGTKIDVQILPQEGRFNLNSLATAEQLMHFVNLLRLVDTQINLEQAFDLAFNLKAWLSPGARLDRGYLQARPSYRQAHAPLTHLSEWRLVKGVTPALYHKLAPYVTVLPTQANVLDVNSMSAPVLASLSGLPLDKAQQIVQCRNHAGRRFTDLDTFIRQCGMNAELDPGIFTTDTTYFLVRALAQQNGEQQVLLSLVQRVKTDRGWAAQILWQEYQDE